MNYFVEGLQGSGKSTLLNHIAEKKPDYTAIREGDYSPVELSWCAYMDAAAYQSILEQYPDLRDKIIEKTYSEGDRKIVCYTKIQAENPAFYQDLERYEIYNDRVSFETFQAIILSRFAAWHQDRMIFECSLFQNIVEDMILFRCASDDEILDFYRRIRMIIEDKPYHIVYLKAQDIKANIDVIRKDRSDDQGNELWFPLMLGFFDASPYAQAHGLCGEDDLIRHFQHRQDLELRICKEVFHGKYTILNAKKYSDADLVTL